MHLQRPILRHLILITCPGMKSGGKFTISAAIFAMAIQVMQKR